MTIYESLLFLHGHLADPALADSLADGPDPRRAATAPARPVARAEAPVRTRTPLVAPRRRARGPAPLRTLGDCG